MNLLELINAFQNKYNESVNNANNNFTRIDKCLSEIIIRLCSNESHLDALKKENEKLKADITEMKRQYNFHLHQGNYSHIFHSDRMEPCIDCLTKDK